MARVAPLDSLRGLGAIVVAFHHAILTFNVAGNVRLYEYAPFAALDGIQPKLAMILMLLVGNGTAAIVLFFLLSGYVLGLMLDTLFAAPMTLRQRAAMLGAYGVRRLLRIYPTHLFVLFFFILPYVFFIHDSIRYVAASDWYHFMYQQWPSAQEVIDNAVLKSWTLTNVLWTLKIELIGSVILPLLWYVDRKLPVFFSVLMLAFLVYCQNYSIMLGPFAADFLFCFQAGVMLPRILRWLPNAPACFLLALPLYLLGSSLHLFSNPLLTPMTPYCLYASASLLIIAGIVKLAQAGRKSWCDTAALQQIGRVSYSLYLLHFIVLYVIATNILSVVPQAYIITVGPLPAVALALMAIAISVLLAVPLHYYVERPANRMGARFTAAVGRKTNPGSGIIPGRDSPAG